MKKVYLLGLAMAGFAAGIYVQGCSGSGTSDGGSTACHADTDCASTDACDTATGQCMQKCTSGSDCSPTTTCAVNNTGASTVCTCAIDAQCPSGSVCNTGDSACQVKCVDNTGCQGYATARTCNTATGQCVGGTITDAGNTDAGNTACGPSALCTAGNFCDPSTNTCVAGTACTTIGTQGPECPAGQACYSGSDLNTVGNICRVVANPDTSLANCAVSTNTDPNTAPTIWGVTKTTISDPAGSCNGTVDQYQGFWYDPSGNIQTGHYTGTSGPSAVYKEVVGVDSSGNTANSSGSTYYTYYDVDIETGTFSFEQCSDNTGIVGVVLVTSGNVESNVACISE